MLPRVIGGFLVLWRLTRNPYRIVDGKTNSPLFYHLSHVVLALPLRLLFLLNCSLCWKFTHSYLKLDNFYILGNTSGFWRDPCYNFEGNITNNLFLCKSISFHNNVRHYILLYEQQQHNHYFSNNVIIPTCCSSVCLAVFAGWRPTTETSVFHHRPLMCRRSGLLRQTRGRLHCNGQRLFWHVAMWKIAADSWIVHVAISW